MALNDDEKKGLLQELNSDWSINSQGVLERNFTFDNFVKAMDFAQKITPVAEADNHHPDLHIGWGKCKVEIFTHSIKDLSKKDFILAAKIDKL